MPSRARYIWLAAIILLVNLAFGWHYHAAVSAQSDQAQAYGALNRFAAVMQYIRRFYVNPEKIDYDQLVEGAIDGMIRSLDDPFSSYIPPSQFEEVSQRTDGQFAGIGVVIDRQDDRITVVAPIPNSPGHLAGVLPGDQIIEVGGESVIGAEINDVVDKIKGQPGTEVNITFYRPSTKQQMNLDLTRAIVDVESVRHVEMLTEEVGYFHITQFTKRTAEETARAIQALLAQDMKALVIDVRDNPGGLLDSANDVCSLFLPEGTLVCFTEGRDPSQNSEFYVTPGIQHMVNRYIVVLTNGNSASGAEILAGCLGDNRRAVLLGTRTYGKGSVQTIYGLSEQHGGGGLRLTVAHYYTPGRRVIHHQGIAPHIEVTITDPKLEARLRDNRNSYIESIQWEEDPQIAKAIEVLNGLLAQDPRPRIYPLDLRPIATDSDAIAPLPTDRPARVTPPAATDLPGADPEAARGDTETVGD